MRLFHAANLFRPVLIAALLFAVCPSVFHAQPSDVDPSLKFHFEELPPGPIVLFPGIDQPPPEFTSNGIVLQFGPYQTSPGAPGGMESAMIDFAPSGIDSPSALFLTGTSALFDLSGANLMPDETITSVAIQLQGDGSGAPLNLGVNGALPFVGPAGQVPADLPGGITVEVIPGELPAMATLILNGNLTQLQIGGNIAMGNLLVYTEGGGGNPNDIPGCTDSTAANFDPNATMNDGSCEFTVVFTVDLNVAGAPAGPTFINGTFNNWCGNCNPMGGFGNVWTVALDLPAGLHEYKFTTANWAEQEQFPDGEPCTMTTSTPDGVFVNRFIEVAGPLTLPPVCWNSCDPCGTPCADQDNDNICDDQDDCIGVIDQCGVCNGNNDCLGNDVQGCTQVNACNYNPDATVDDGTCNFDGSHLFAMTLSFDQYPVETTWSLVDALGDTVMAGGPYVNGTDNFATHVITATLCAGCYTLTVNDQFGDGMCCQFGDGSYSLAIDDQTVASGGEFTEFETTEVCTPGFSGAGCTYEVALNYDPNAIEDDGSCIFDFQNPCLNDIDGDGVCDEDEVPGCTSPCSCNYVPEATDDDGSCLDADAIGMCGGDCLSDLDADGVCDDQDPCIGFVDECGVCNGPGATLPCGCSDIPPGACDCEGNLIDAFGICGGTCPTDLDGDGECDDVDCCIGGYDECGVCNGPGAVFDCGCEMMPLGACDCQGNQLDALGVCGGDCPSDLDGDGVCDVFDDCIGFYDACGVCNGPGPMFTCGCFMQPLGDCDCEGNQLDALGICGGDCTSDLDGDGICDSNEIPGCTNPEACNYSPQATDDNGSCEFAPEGLDCDLTCINDIDQDGICDDDEVLGCMDETACNYFPPATDDVGCLYPSFGYDCFGNCIHDADDDGVCDANEIAGCTDQDACNFLPEATDESGTCVYATALYDCNGDCISDQDGDGICDGQEILGCLDQTACNYNPNATSLDPNLPCLFPVAGYNCLGECTQDVNDNGICDFLEESGCTDPTACNYNPSATSLDPNLPCLFPIPGYNCNGEGIVFGCMDPMACNFNPDATNSANASCEFAPPGFGCDGQCLDFDGDGVCNVDEINGCTYVDAENFNADATEDDGTCTFPEGPGESGCPDIDGDGTVAIGDLLELLGQFGEESDC